MFFLFQTKRIKKNHTQHWIFLKNNMSAQETTAKDVPDTVHVLLDIQKIIAKIERNQAPAGFNAGTATALAIAAAFSFILALALNQFFQLLFAKIPVGGGLLGAAIYAVIALVICVLALFLIYRFLEPFLHKKFAS